MVAKLGASAAPGVAKPVVDKTPAAAVAKPATTVENKGWVPGTPKARPTPTSVAVTKVAEVETFSKTGVSADQLRKVMPNLSPEKAEAMLPHLNKAMKEFGIDTPQRASAFLAQLAHESGELKYFEELASGSAYEGRRDLGNTQSGDGQRFKGRGPIQLTGRANYAAASKALGIDLVNNPELAARPDIGFRIAGWFWQSKGLNNLADQGDFNGITKRVNGGYNGAASRNQYYAKAQAALGGGLSGGPLSTSDTPVPAYDRPARRYDMPSGSTYATSNAQAGRMVDAYAQRGGGFDANSLYLAIMMMMAAYSGTDWSTNPEFLEFAKQAGWQPGTEIPEALVTEFMANKLTTMAQTNPNGLEGAIADLQKAAPVQK